MAIFFNGSKWELFRDNRAVIKRSPNGRVSAYALDISGRPVGQGMALRDEDILAFNPQPGDTIEYHSRPCQRITITACLKAE